MPSQGQKVLLLVMVFLIKYVDKLHITIESHHNAIQFNVVLHTVQNNGYEKWKVRALTTKDIHSAVLL